MTAPEISHPDFEMFQYNNTEESLKYFDKEIYMWDSAVYRQGFYDYTERIEDASKLKKNIQYIFFKAKTPKTKALLYGLDFEKLSQKNTTMPGFGKADVVKYYKVCYTSTMYLYQTEGENVMAKECLACGKSMGAFTGKVAVADGHVCMDCWTKAGMDITSLTSGPQYTGAAIKEIIAIKERNQSLIANFKPTKKVGIISFDDNTQSFVIFKSKKNQDLYYYNQIVDFELQEDGESIAKGGLGRAVAGGLLFGGVGAIVGGVTGGKKTKSVCKSLKIKITFRNNPRQTEYIPFITTETKTGGFIYKTAYQSAQDTLSALQIAVDMVNNTPVEAAPVQQAASGADEILKYKGLLDAGIITEEEFNVKKAQILGL